MAATSQYRVRWEIDIEATSELEAARKAEAVMRTPADGERDQARVMLVSPLNNGAWTELDLADPDLRPSTAPVLPPEHSFARARSWKIFRRTFHPLEVTPDSFMLQPEDIPEHADPREWWTVVDYAPDTPRLYLTAGFTRANRLGVVRCLHPWGGNADDHPLYIYQ
jgi:hypothetical protein